MGQSELNQSTNKGSKQSVFPRVWWLSFAPSCFSKQGLGLLVQVSHPQPYNVTHAGVTARCNFPSGSDSFGSCPQSPDSHPRSWGGQWKESSKWAASGGARVGPSSHRFNSLFNVYLSEAIQDHPINSKLGNDIGHRTQDSLHLSQQTCYSKE